MRMIPTTRAASIPSRRVTISASNMVAFFSTRLSRAPGTRGGAPGAGGSGRGGRARAVAPLAVAADLVRVIRHPELLPAADFVLETLDVTALELDDGAAAETDHVIVVMTPEHRLVARLALGHFDLVDEAGLDE